MAKNRKQKKQQPGTAKASLFDKSLNEDVKDYHASPQSWSQARNAVNNTTVGDIGELSNETSNYLCQSAPYTIIGSIHLDADRWVVFSTDNTQSEIGLFIETTCDYTTIVNDDCLKFSQDYPITGISKENFECKWQVYWSDALNPDRVLNIDDVPWIQDCRLINDCNVCTDTTDLDCDALRLEPLMNPLCFRAEKGPSGGELLNGTYYVVGAYSENGQRICDWSLPSNPVGLFAHVNTASALEIHIEAADTRFDDFELVIVYMTQGSTLAKSVGIYSTRQKRISIDAIIETWTEINPGLIPLVSPIAEKSDGIFESGKYSLRIGPTSKFDFNYQPIANQISTHWMAVEYDQKYYGQAGINTGYMRDEVYAFFIRWVYDTGDKSPSFHIPGRTKEEGRDDVEVGLRDGACDLNDGVTLEKWSVLNTAYVTNSYNHNLADGGHVLGKGRMGYWESSEIYDNDNPQIWNGTYVNPDIQTWDGDPNYFGNIGETTNTNYDLCGKPIRHHRFPENATDTSNAHHPITNHFRYDVLLDRSYVIVMGVEFDNIKPPLDNNGAPIKGIVGYEILRGSREGNKSILAKGMLNNMRAHAKIDNPNDSTEGAYVNHPYNSLGKDMYFSRVRTYVSGVHPKAYSSTDLITTYGNTLYHRDFFSFHSPDTNFKDPYLSAKQLRIYGNLHGWADLQFVEPTDHPRGKLLTDFAAIVAAIGGLLLSAVKLGGQSRYTGSSQNKFNLALNAPAIGLISGVPFSGYTPGMAATYASNLPQIAAVPGSFGGFVTDVVTGSSFKQFYEKRNNLDFSAGSYPGYQGTRRSWETDLPAIRMVGGAAAGGFAAREWRGNFIKYTNNILNLMKAASKWRQFALQLQSHCYYNEWNPPTADNHKRCIYDSVYLGSGVQEFLNHRVNNQYRSRAVLLKIGYKQNTPLGTYVSQPVDNPTIIDGTNQILESQPHGNYSYTKSAWDSTNNKYEEPTLPWKRIASSHYVGLRQRLRNQYGQIDGIMQVPVSTCIRNTTDGVYPSVSLPLFNGDIYIGRYTEKNTCFMFTDWMYKQPDGYEFNYKIRNMMPWTMCWMDSAQFDISMFWSSIWSSVASGSFGQSGWITPSDLHNLDRNYGTAGKWFVIQEAYFYLFTSGVKDFFVESEINVGYRDYGEEVVEQHYDYSRYTDLRAMFDTAIIKAGNYFKYDFALSISRLFNNYTRWSNVQPRDYDPFVAEKCYVYRPRRVVYSLPQTTENKSDNWRIFLPYNYKDFKSRISAIRPTGKSGALFLFHNDSPQMFAGVDQLQTEGGVKITIGDGGLFSQPLQNLVNADEPNEYGSCQNKLAVINTPVGVYWMSQNQGKIFTIASSIKEISNIGMKWWFSTYLPYRLTKDFPNFKLKDNPLTGIGCQTIYDNDNQIVFFCKRDYELRKDLPATITYDEETNTFLANDLSPITLGDPNYFKDASWTISYDPKTQAWISYHDWHPDFVIPSKNTFMTTKADGIWVHNDMCNSFCKFYGDDYPFEVEYAVHTNNQVMTLRSVEYFMEAFKYGDNCFDRFHDLDYNFDEAIIYNSEQCSGLLDLNLSPANNVVDLVKYPKINPASIDILFSKVEQKYRFNQFWDITADRGEFNPSAQRTIFDTQPNGYIRDLNSNNLDYNKFALQRKRFRHYKNTVLLRKKVSGDINVVVALAVNKNLVSPR